MFDKLDEIEVRFQTIETDLADPGVIADRTLYTALMREHSELSAVVEAYRRRRQMAAELEGTRELADDPDGQLREMAREEAAGLTAAIAETDEERRAALAKILPIQIADFEEIFEAMDGLPAVVRLLDPPLHEFLPKTDEDLKALAEDTRTTVDQIKTISNRLHEFNPMLGHRGCRLGLSHPEIYEMQAEAILTAACNVAKRGVTPVPEIMIPLVAEASELRVCREIVEKAGREVFEREGVEVDYKVGTMIELPRACIVADAVAEHAEFFSFGTNDLTQTVYGLSRDDAGGFLPTYIERRFIAGDPFVAIDPEGVGAMVRMGVDLGRKTRPDLKIGICGEHGGEPSSVAFFYDAKLDYVSCSPYRVPIARLAAAQAQLRNPDGGVKDGKGRAGAD